MSKVYKVWSADRSVKKLVKAEGLKELIKKGKQKLGYGVRERVSTVVDCDGTCVEDEDYFNTLPSLSRLMLIRDGESWSLGPPEGSYDQPDADMGEFEAPDNMAQALHMLRQDITKIVTLNKEELQVMVDFDQVQLARGLNVPAHEVVRVQDKCQRYLDELEDSQEALELLRIIKNAKQESNTEAQSLSENSQEGSTSQSYVTEDQPTRKRTKKS